MNIFSIEYSEEEISLKLDVNHKDWMTFNDNFDNVLKEHVPKKIKPHVSNTLRSTLWSVPIWKKKSIKLHYPAKNKIIKKKQRNLVPKSSKQLKKIALKISKIKNALICWISTIMVTLNWEGGSRSWKDWSCKCPSFRLWISNRVPWYVRMGALALQRCKKLGKSIIERISHDLVLIEIRKNFKISKKFFIHTSNSWYCEKHYKQIT